MSIYFDFIFTFILAFLPQTHIHLQVQTPYHPFLSICVILMLTKPSTTSSADLPRSVQRFANRIVVSSRFFKSSDTSTRTAFPSPPFPNATLSKQMSDRQYQTHWCRLMHRSTKNNTRHCLPVNRHYLHNRR